MAKLIKKVKVGKNQPINISAPNNNALKAKADRIYQPVVGNMVVQDKYGNVVDAGFSATQLQETLEDLSDKDTDLQDQIDELESNLATTDAKASSAYHFKGTKASVSALPSSGNQVGDVWNVGNDLDGGNYAWTGSAWDKLGDTIDLTPYLTKTEASNTYETKTHAASTYATKAELEDVNVSGTDPNAFNGVSASKTGSTTTLTFTKGDNTTSSVSFTDSNTVYDDSNVVHATGTGASDHIVLDGTTLQINPTTHKVYASISAQLTFEQVADFFQSGGGLVVDPTNNKVYFDADSLDNVKLQKLLRKINVPAALTSNTTFYVDGNTSSDPLVSDLTAGTNANPFKTLQACVNYVTKYYNIADYTATISCKNVNETSLILPDFSKGTGRIVIKLDSTATENEKIVISYSPTSANKNSIEVLGGEWYLYDFDVYFNNENVSSSGGHSSAMSVKNFATAYIYRSSFTYTDSHPTDISFAGQHNIFLQNSAFLHIYQGNSIIGIDSDANNTTYRINGISVNDFATVRYDSDAAGVSKLTYNGKLRTFVYANSGSWNRNGVTIPVVDVSNAETNTGYKYHAINGGHINTGKRTDSTDYFGATNTGTVDAESYSWYK